MKSKHKYIDRKLASQVFLTLPTHGLVTVKIFTTSACHKYYCLLHLKKLSLFLQHPKEKYLSF